MRQCMPELAIVGYGKMGKLIEQLAPEYAFTVALKLDEFNNANGEGITAQNFRGIDGDIDSSEILSGDALTIGVIELIQLQSHRKSVLGGKLFDQLSHFAVAHNRKLRHALPHCARKRPGRAGRKTPGAGQRRCGPNPFLPRRSSDSAGKRLEK